MNIFYGCYQANYTKHYKWQCQKFNSETDATNFTLNASDKSIDGKTLLIPVNQYIPVFLHKLILKTEIIKTENIDIK